MVKQIFVNLPIKDLKRSVEFFTRLGFTFDARFTDQNATCMVVGEQIFVMLLVEDYFRTFIRKDVADTRRTAAAIVALQVEDRAEVDALLEKAVSGGAATPMPQQDHGFMYLRGFEDLDGHLWEIFHMSGLPPQPSA